jgi:curved DNA-binding protein CbpA
MPGRVRSPYETLGVSPAVSDAELRAAYRRLVQLHHPDHNDNSPESTRRFEEIQDAYAEVVRLRKSSPPPRARAQAQTQPQADADPKVESRMADLEREVRAAHAARERVRRAAREAAAAAAPTERPSDEELGYVKTDDSFTKILTDARAEIVDRFSEAREHPVIKRVSDLIDGLEELSSKLDPDPRKRSRK